TSFSRDWSSDVCSSDLGTTCRTSLVSRPGTLPVPTRGHPCVRPSLSSGSSERAPRVLSRRPPSPPPGARVVPPESVYSSPIGGVRQNPSPVRPLSILNNHRRTVEALG